MLLSEMTVTWTDFLSIATIITELYDSIYYFEERGKPHEEVRKAAEKYRDFFKNTSFAKLIEGARKRLEISN